MIGTKQEMNGNDIKKKLPRTLRQGNERGGFITIDDSVI